MGIIRKLFIVTAALLVIAAAWVCWSRPVRVDMAGYVPGDSIVYIEANGLPELLAGLTSTDAWRELAPEADVPTDYGRFISLSRFAALTGIGKNDWVVLSRAQVAITVLGFDAVERPDASLHVSPRVALVAETHTSEWRLRGAVEKLAGDFARRSYGSPSVERKEVDGTQFITWADPSGSRRKLVAAVSGSVAVIGNDEAAVRACLSVRRGERPSLAGNEQLGLMREQLGAGDSLAFGFVPAGSPAKIVEVFAPAFVADVSPDAQIQSLLASFLPQLVNRIVGGISWSSKVVNGAVEDHYFITLPDNLGDRLTAPFQPAPNSEFGAASFLPPKTYQVSRYTFYDPALAWRGLNAGLSSQVSVVQAAYIARALEALLRPYGVESPREFFPAAGSEIVTARLDQSSESKVLIAVVRERDALRKQVVQVLGGSFQTEKVGDDQLMVSKGSEKRAASFSGSYLLMGEEEDLRRCLTSRAANQTLRNTDTSQAVATSLFPEQPFVTTLTADAEQARSVVLYVAGKGGTHRGGSGGGVFEQKLSQRPYSLSQTRLTAQGIEKKTRSSFGLIGEVLVRLTNTEAGGLAEGYRIPKTTGLAANE